MDSSFTGFSPATFRFLGELKKNNSRDWFNEHKPDYESKVLEPSLAFIESMQSPLKRVSPFFKAVARRSGGSLMRVYRDTRFSKDKTPYKTNIGIHFRHEQGKDVHAPGFYCHLEPKDSFFGAGIWHPDGPSLRKIRNLIVEDAARWKRISRAKKMRGQFEFAGGSLKRPPRDFEPEHPLIDDLKRKDFIVIAPLKQTELEDAKLGRTIAAMMKDTMPLVRFLCDALKLPS